jgi:probable F420-dependent oxidoreductase
VNAGLIKSMGLGAASVGDEADLVETAAELEELGYSTFWLPGRLPNNLAEVPAIVRGTRRITVATGIVSMDRVPAAEVANTYLAHPDRFLAGLGGAHGPRPLATVNAYLDELEPVVPKAARVLSALGPRMLTLARDRAAGAYPYLVTTDYVAAARELVGPDTLLAVLVTVVAEADPAKARDIVRGGSLPARAAAPGYAANLRRMGFTERDIVGLSDRLVDGVTVWGDLDTVVRRLSEYRAAGADQVVIQLGGVPGEWRAELPSALG